jgi:hypothetical protein
MTARLSVRGFSRTFNGVRVLDDVHLGKNFDLTLASRALVKWLTPVERAHVAALRALRPISAASAIAFARIQGLRSEGKTT